MTAIPNAYANEEGAEGVPAHVPQISHVPTFELARYFVATKPFESVTALLTDKVPHTPCR